MSFDSTPAPKPDPGIADAAEMQASLGQQYLDWAKDQFKISTDRQAQLDDLTKQVQQQHLAAGQQQLDYAQQDRDRYNTVFKPVEDQFVTDATSYDTPQRQAEAAAEAGADVQNQAAIAKGTAQRQAFGLGIRPDSGRFAGIDRASDLGTALATAGAENTARQGVRDKGLALEGQVANLGRGLPTQADAETASGLTAGSAAVGLGQANQNLSNAATGIITGGYNTAQAGYGNEASALSSLYGDSLNAWNAQNQIDSQNLNGITSAIGLGAGLLTGGSKPWIFSSKKLKTGKTPIKDGEALDTVKSMPVENWRYKPGVQDGGAVEHTGPYAEDMQAATGSGDGTTIQLQDEVGLTLKAVQDLAKKVDTIEKAVGLGTAKAPLKKAPAKPAPKATPKPVAKAPPPRPQPRPPIQMPPPGRAVGIGGQTPYSSY